jgi:saccharopepsin
MMEQKLLKSNMFAFYLTDEKDKVNKSDLTFGYYDKTKFKGDMQWHDIKYKYMFGVQLDDIKVNGKA